MIYKDRATLRRISKHQSNLEDKYWTPMSNREKTRIQKRWLKEFRNKVPNQFWWDSLTIDEQIKAANMHSFSSLQEVMIKYPGSLSYQRELKLNKILDGSIEQI